MPDCPEVGYTLNYTPERYAYLSAEFAKDLAECEGTPPATLIKYDMTRFPLSSPFIVGLDAYADSIWGNPPNQDDLSQVPSDAKLDAFATWALGENISRGPFNVIGINSQEGLNWFPFSGWTPNGQQHANWTYSGTAQPINAKMKLLLDKIRQRFVGTALEGVSIGWYGQSPQKSNPNDSEVVAFRDDPLSIMNQLDVTMAAAYAGNGSDIPGYVAKYQGQHPVDKTFGKPVIPYVWPVASQNADPALDTFFPPNDWRQILQVHVDKGDGFNMWMTPGRHTPATPGMQELIDIAVAVQKGV